MQNSWRGQRVWPASAASLAALVVLVPLSAARAYRLASPIVALSKFTLCIAQALSGASLSGLLFQLRVMP